MRAHRNAVMNHRHETLKERRTDEAAAGVVGVSEQQKRDDGKHVDRHELEEADRSIDR